MNNKMDYLNEAIGLHNRTETVYPKNFGNEEIKSLLYENVMIYLLADIALSLRDISSGVHSLDTKT